MGSMHHSLQMNSEHRQTIDSKDISVEENDEIDEELRRQDRLALANSKTINDILKYGAHQLADSNPIETQSEWSDDDDEAKGKVYLHRLSCVFLCFFFCSRGNLLLFEQKRSFFVTFMCFCPALNEFQVEWRVQDTSPTSPALKISLF